MNKKFKKVLVTGADGFIGSHLTEELVRLGYDVRAFVLYNSFNSWGWLDSSSTEIKKAVDVFAGDIRDPYGVRKAIEGCDAVLHLAALIGIPYSYHSPATYVDTNISGTLNVLQASIDANVTKIVHTSTSEVYGSALRVPIDEDHPLQGQSPYSATKIGADQLALSFFRSFDCPVTIVRPFNTYGPRQSARAVIPSIITQLLAGKRELHLGAIHPTRDLNYVSDTVGGFLAALNHDEAKGEVINIGSGFEISIEGLAYTIGEIMGVPVKITSHQERMRPEKSEVDRLWADNSKALRLLGWQPKYGSLAGLKEGLKATVDWFSQPANQSLYKEGYTI